MYEGARVWMVALGFSGNRAVVWEGDGGVGDGWGLFWEEEGWKGV